MEHGVVCKATRQCSGLIWPKILTAHNFGAFGSENSDNRTYSRISGQILGENPLENPDSVRILPKKILTGSQNGRRNYDNPEDRDSATRQHGSNVAVPCMHVKRQSCCGL